MQISVALDGPKRRDLEFFDGDSTTVNLTVYAVDGDTVPVVATDITFTTYTGALNPDVVFLADFIDGSSYRIRGTVAGNTLTLAYGRLTTPPGMCGFCCFCDYGLWMPGPEPLFQPEYYVMDGYIFDGGHP